jgi:hypothetical protein
MGNLKLCLRGAGICILVHDILSESLSIAREGIFLELSEGDRHFVQIHFKGDIPVAAA